MERFLSNCSQNNNMTLSSGKDRSIFISNTGKSNLISTNKVSDRTFQTNINRLFASEKTYIAPEAPSSEQLLENHDVFKVPTSLPPRRETSIYSTSVYSAGSSRTRLQPARDDLNFNGLQILWNETFMLITRTMPLTFANDFVRGVQDLYMAEMWQKSHNSACGSSHASDVQEWLSSNPVGELGILPSQATQPKSVQAPVSSLQVEDIQSSVGPGHLSTIADISIEDDIGLQLNSFPNCHLQDKTLLRQKTDTSKKNTEDKSSSRETNTVNKRLENNGSVKPLKDGTNKISDESKSKNKSLYKLQKTYKSEEKTARAQKQKQTTVSDTTVEGAVSSRGRKIIPCLKYWEGEKLSQTNIRTDPDTSLTKCSKYKETNVSLKLNESMTLRSHKQLNNISRKPDSGKKDIRVRERISKSKENKQKFSSTIDSEGHNEKVSRSVNRKSLKHGNMPQAKDFENKHEEKSADSEEKVADSEEKENKNCNVKPTKKIIRKNPQKQKSNETVKANRKRKVNSSVEMPNKKKKACSEQRQPQMQEDILNASFNLFGYSTKSRLSDSFSQATPGTALNSIRKKAQGSGPLSKETPPSKHLASVLNNSEVDSDQSQKIVKGAADNVNKKNHVNQRVASKMSKGANGVKQVKVRKEKRQLKSANDFDDKTSAVLNDVIHGHKAGQKTPKNIATIFRAHMKESYKNKLSGNSDTSLSDTDSDNDDLY